MQQWATTWIVNRKRACLKRVSYQPRSVIFTDFECIYGQFCRQFFRKKKLPPTGKCIGKPMMRWNYTRGEWRGEWRVGRGLICMKRGNGRATLSTKTARMSYQHGMHILPKVNGITQCNFGRMCSASSTSYQNDVHIQPKSTKVDKITKAHGYVNKSIWLWWQKHIGMITKAYCYDNTSTWLSLFPIGCASY